MLVVYQMNVYGGPRSEAAGDHNPGRLTRDRWAAMQQSDLGKAFAICFGESNGARDLCAQWG